MIEPVDPAARFASIPRRTSELEFGSPHPVFRATLEDHAVSIGSNSLTQIEFDWWEFSDDRFFVEDAMVGSYIQTVDVVGWGIWLINASIEWDLTPTWNTTIIIHDPYRNSVATYESTSNAGEDQYTLCVMRTFTPFDALLNFTNPDPPTPTAFEIGVSLNQDSGSAKNTGKANLEIAYVGPMDAPSPTPNTLTAFGPGRVLPVEPQP